MDENNNQQQNKNIQIPERGNLRLVDSAQRQPSRITPAQNRNHQNNGVIAQNQGSPIAVNQLHNKQAVSKVDLSESQQTKASQIRENHSNIRPENYGEHWKKYHEAWQNYYQKYYESYYSKALQKHVEIQSRANKIEPQEDENLSDEEKRQRALAKIKSDISKKAQEKASKIRKSRHFAPIFISGLVVLVFLFLQYNRMIFGAVEAYVSPGNAVPQDVIRTPNASNKVSQEPKLIIPKINVDVPVVYGVGNDQDSQLQAMNHGVAHFAVPGADSVPGQIGNTVLSGHSSNDLFDGGDYKFIFAQLDRIKEGDVFYANYEGVQYSYVVRRSEIVMPHEVGKIILDVDKPWMTLITCTPLGTAEKRLLIFAEQISPDPNSAKPKNETSNDNKKASLPRNSLTFFERLLAWKWD